MSNLTGSRAASGVQRREPKTIAAHAANISNYLRGACRGIQWMQ
jgi:hypothetical protein